MTLPQSIINHAGHRVGPHGVDIDADHGVTRYTLKGLSSKVHAQLKRELKRAASSGKGAA